MSFQHTDVDSTTYSKWLRSGSRVGVADTLPHSKRLFDTHHIEYFRGSEGYDHTGFYDGRYSMVKNTTKYSGGNNNDVDFLEYNNYNINELYTYWKDTWAYRRLKNLNIHI